MNLKITLTPEQVAACVHAAGQRKQRSRRRQKDGRSSNDQEVISVEAEFAFALMLGLPEHEALRHINSLVATEGYQFEHNFNRIKIASTGSAAQFLPVKAGQIHADIYVLARVDEQHGVEFKGWAHGHQIEASPATENEWGGISHRYPARRLMSMALLP